MKPYYDVVREVLKCRDGCSDRCEERSGCFSFARRIMKIGIGTHLCAKSIVISKTNKVTRMNIVITSGTSTIASIIVTSAEVAEGTDLYLRVDGGGVWA
jgi:hypothetical protein